MDEFRPDSFSGTVPVFPLPNVVLFPHLMLPLHIFEPRYRRMTRDVLEGEGLIAMALYRPGWEDAEEGIPPVHDVVGLGKIVHHVELSEGRYNLMLLGVARARVVRWVQESPYLIAQAEILRPEPEPMDVASAQGRREALREAFGAHLAEPAWGLPLPVLCDLIAGTLVADPLARQLFLETLNLAERCKGLIRLAPSPTPRRRPRVFPN